MSIIDALWRNQRGNVAMMFAFTMIPLIGAVGAAVDYSRLSHMRTMLADSLDAALLAVGSQPPMNNRQTLQAVGDWMAVHMATGATGTWQLDSVSQTDEKLVAVASANVDMTLSRVLGIEQVPISITSEVVRTLDKVELVMVLDNTGSMRGIKITRLKEAAAALVDSLAEATRDPAYLRIGLVPFSQTVNVGPQYRNADWLDADGKSATARSLFLDQEVNRFDLFAALGETWGGCVETRAMPWEASGAAPDPSQPDSLYVPYFAPDEPGDRGERWYNNSYLDDRPLPAILASVGHARAMVPTFQYLQGDPFKYAGQPYRGTTRAFGYVYGPNSGCEIAPLLRLSSDTAAVKTAVDAMIAQGNTDIPIGLAWGRNVLRPDGPFGDGVAYGNTEWTKVAVLMTDGNNENAEGNVEDESYYAGVGYIWQGRMGATSARKPRRTELRDQRLAEICAEMKGNDIVIYTVRVEVKVGSSDVLRQCASDEEKFYDVDNVADLVTAFADIGSSIQKLRLAR